MSVTDLVNGKTKVFGIIGNPIEHSFSPILQNTVARVMGENIAYVPFKVGSGEVKTALDGAFMLGICGFNVTVPHKKEVMESLVAIDDLALKIGAVNTLKYTEKGYKGYNTDILGLGKCFDIEGISIKKKTVVILGAGGAANSAAILAAEREAGNIVIVNRTKANAQALKEQTARYYNGNIDVISFEELMSIENPQIVIQTTSVGMGEGVWKSPVENTSFFKKVQAVVDIVYTPWQTKLLCDAKENDCVAINGFDMLIYQGLASYEIWHDVKIDDNTSKALRNELADYYIAKR
ncbi:MAG: shikimate dehydrogenase [Lachnospiraceae bacterium]|nr:shikimate dehydrogenase [Lachnospiraceae bacterium]